MRHPADRARRANWRNGLESHWSNEVSLCAGLHGGRLSHRVVEVFQDLCLARIVKSVVKAANDV